MENEDKMTNYGRNNALVNKDKQDRINKTGKYKPKGKRSPAKQNTVTDEIINDWAANRREQEQEPGAVINDD